MASQPTPRNEMASNSKRQNKLPSNSKPQIEVASQSNLSGRCVGVAASSGASLSEQILNGQAKR